MCESERTPRMIVTIWCEDSIKESTTLKEHYHERVFFAFLTYHDLIKGEQQTMSVHPKGLCRGAQSGGTAA